MKIETLELAKINPAVYNPRKDLKPGDAEYEKLKRSILEFDMVEPLVWNKQTGNLVGGHQRLKVLQELGVKTVEVSVVDLSEVKEKALNIALNKISGEWDFPKLKDLLEEMDTGEFDIEVTGFSVEEIEDLMTQFHVDDEIDETYTSKVVPPVYEPKGDCPALTQLYDNAKTQSLIAEIEDAKIPSDIAGFLKLAAERHTAFNFRHIAEFYCHASPKVQDLMEKSGLVIIDFNKAIEYGFVKMTKLLGEIADREKEDAE